MWYVGAIKDDEWSPWASMKSCICLTAQTAAVAVVWSTDRNESIGESSLPRPFVPFLVSLFGNAALISSHHQCLPYSLSSASPQSIRVPGTPNFQDQQGRSSEHQSLRVLIRQLKERWGGGKQVTGLLRLLRLSVES